MVSLLLRPATGPCVAWWFGSSLSDGSLLLQVVTGILYHMTEKLSSVFIKKNKKFLGRRPPFNTRGRAQYYAQVYGRARIRGRARGQGRRKILRRGGGRGKAGVYTVYIPHTHLTPLYISTFTPPPLRPSLPPSNRSNVQSSPQYPLSAKSPSPHISKPTSPRCRVSPQTFFG